MNQAVTIRQLINTDIPAVVSLHLLSLPNTMSSRIGPDYLSLLYSSLLYDKNALPLVAVKNDTVVGCVTATRDLTRTSDHLRSIHFKAAPIITKALLNRKISFNDLINKLLFERALVKQFGLPYPTVLTLFVSPTIQGQGIGKQLVNTVLKQYKQHHLCQVYVDTEENNTPAQKFYEHLGGIVVTTMYGSRVYQL